MAETFEAKGVNGRLVVGPEKVTIVRKGAMSVLTQGLKGDKDIMIEDISSIQVRQPKLGSRGYIQFAFKGGRETKGGLVDAVKDENSILFDKKHSEDIMRAKELIEQYRAQSRSVAAGGGHSDASELEKLAELRDKGILTDEEFQAKKKEILGL